MALLEPNNIYTIHGVTVREKIIPDGTRWKNAAKAIKAGFSANALYKKECKLTNNTGKPLSVTIHNTNDLANVEDDAEQYTRATYNENMNTARVHFYVDDLGAWQNLKAGTGMCKNDPDGAAEVGWHAGDGSASDGGNMTSLSIEIIMGDTADHDANAKDNGARLAAWLLWKHGLPVSALITHTYWVNKSAGKRFDDPDEQCTNLISGKKWCPSNIFGSTNHAVALANWKSFKALVKGYLDMLSGNTVQPKEATTVIEAKDSEVKELEAGDLVKLANNATYYSGKRIPDWVIERKWYIKSIKGDRAVIDKDEEGKFAINSPVHTTFLSVVRKAFNEDTQTAFQPYLVRITTDDLNIRKGAGTDYACTGRITDRGVYTIVAESYGQGASLWGKLKSGAGWISLDYTKKL